MQIRLREIAALLLLISLLGGELLACNEYVHLWRPVSEEKSSVCSAEGVALFLQGLAADQLSAGGEKWLVGLSPDSVVTASFVIELQRAVSLLDNKKFAWAEGGSPFVGDSPAPATIWLDFVNPERLVYIWRDENKPPFAMFRTGELDTARIRVLAMSGQRKIILIDELPYMFLLESDFMLPSWVSNGGVWFRRLSFKTAQMPQRLEWTLSLPADMEDVNNVPADIKRFYYGNTSSQNTAIISNY